MRTLTRALLTHSNYHTCRSHLSPNSPNSPYFSGGASHGGYDRLDATDTAAASPITLAAAAAWGALTAADAAVAVAVFNNNANTDNGGGAVAVGSGNGSSGSGVVVVDVDAAVDFGGAVGGTGAYGVLQLIISGGGGGGGNNSDKRGNGGNGGNGSGGGGGVGVSADATEVATATAEAAAAALACAPAPFLTNLLRCGDPLTRKAALAAVCAWADAAPVAIISHHLPQRLLRFRDRRFNHTFLLSSFLSRLLSIIDRSHHFPQLLLRFRDRAFNRARRLFQYRSLFSITIACSFHDRVSQSCSVRVCQSLLALPLLPKKILPNTQLFHSFVPYLALPGEKNPVLRRAAVAAVASLAQRYTCDRRQLRSGVTGCFNNSSSGDVSGGVSCGGGGCVVSSNGALQIAVVDTGGGIAAVPLLAADVAISVVNAFKRGVVGVSHRLSVGICEVFYFVSLLSS
jgi:hypothetical protein